MRELPSPGGGEGGAEGAGPTGEGQFMSRDVV